MHVKPEFVEEFIKATMENARNSVYKPGIARFDVIQQYDDRTRFILGEVYRTIEDPSRHKKTHHYKKWRDIVEGMMAEPRSSVKYKNIFPDEESWEKEDVIRIFHCCTNFIWPRDTLHC